MGVPVTGGHLEFRMTWVGFSAQGLPSDWQAKRDISPVLGAGFRPLGTDKIREAIKFGLTKSWHILGKPMVNKALFLGMFRGGRLTSHENGQIWGGGG